MDSFEVEDIDFHSHRAAAEHVGAAIVFPEPDTAIDRADILDAERVTRGQLVSFGQFTELVIGKSGSHELEIDVAVDVRLR